MSWPKSTDYIEAVQNLRSCMSDEELHEGRAAVNEMGLPMLWSGHFADVYKIECPATGNTWALKCFTREVAGLRDRYRDIAAHLDQARLPFTVGFQYLDNGIRVGGQWYPALKMQWVEGLSLNQFVEHHVDRPRTLGQLLGLWPKLARRLREARMAHADLQHGNVILVPMPRGRLALRLIDYDGMFVPSLADRPSGELGHPAYQHPQRLREGTYSAEVDRFSHLTVYCAVRCLKVGRRKLWQRFNNGDNLLFRENDFRRPSESILFRTLWDLPDSEARSLVGRLALACEEPLDQVPLLEDVLVKGEGKALPLDPRQESAVKALLESKPKPPSVPALPVPPVPITGEAGGAPALPLPPDLFASKAGGTRSEALGTRSESSKPPPIEKTLILPPLLTPPEPIAGEAGIALKENAPAISDAGTLPSPPPDAAVNPPGLHDLWAFLPGLAKLFNRDLLSLAFRATSQIPPRAFRIIFQIPHLLAVPVRKADRLLLSLVGEDNTILHSFLRFIVCVALVVGSGVVSTIVVQNWGPNLFLGAAAANSTEKKAEAKSAAEEDDLRQEESKAEAPKWELSDDAAISEGNSSIFEDHSFSAMHGKSGQSPPTAAPRDEKPAKQRQAGSRIAKSSPEKVAGAPSPGSPGPLKLLPIPPQIIEVQKPLTIPLLVENAKRGKEELRFSLGHPRPPSASIDEEKGVFSWTPDETWVGDNVFTVSVASSRDGRRASVSFPILVMRHLQHRSICLDTDGKITLELVSIPAGSFEMGDRYGDQIEKPVHLVTITKEFEIGKFEVTQEQWTAVMDNNPSIDKGPQNPVENVSWNDCQLFLQKISGKFADKAKGERFCLPTEAQWEYACRAESTESYCFGNSVKVLERYAWFRKNSGDRTIHSVGQKLPNIWGLYDMHGGVREWCADWFSFGGYEDSSQEDPLGLPSHGYDMNRHVLRDGGSYDSAWECRASHRDSRTADDRFYATGFRVACIRGYAPTSDGQLRLASIGRKNITAGKTLTFQASVENANDWAGNLRFGLIDKPTNGARINPVTGEFTWQPEEFYFAGQTTRTTALAVPFTVFVSDAEGIQKDLQSFKVYVERPKNKPAQMVSPRLKRP